jgi:hypothetical protein
LGISIDQPIVQSEDPTPVDSAELSKDSSRLKQKPLKPKKKLQKVTLAKAAPKVTPALTRQSSVKGMRPPTADKTVAEKADKKEELEPLTRLKHTDLVYLLNILKLQAAKRNNFLTFNDWVSDCELAFSIVQSSSNALGSDK